MLGGKASKHANILYLQMLCFALIAISLNDQVSNNF